MKSGAEKRAYLGSHSGDGDCGLALRLNRADVCVFFGLTDSLCLAAECSSNWPGVSAMIEFRSESILNGFCVQIRCYHAFGDSVS